MSKFILPDLSYSFDSLEPYIDSQTMQLHHDKHHQAYIDKANKAVEETDRKALNKTDEEVLSNISQYTTTLRNNLGGHYNHSLFWQMLNPNSTIESSPSKVKEMLSQTFGSMDNFKQKFAEAAINQFGSGWAWLIKTNHAIEITSTPNQDNPLMDVAAKKGEILLGLDVWEHAYYLKYQNRRPEYITAFWNIVNWDFISSKLG